MINRRDDPLLGFQGKLIARTPLKSRLSAGQPAWSARRSPHIIASANVRHHLRQFALIVPRIVQPHEQRIRIARRVMLRRKVATGLVASLPQLVGQFSVLRVGWGTNVSAAERTNCGDMRRFIAAARPCLKGASRDANDVWKRS